MDKYYVIVIDDDDNDNKVTMVRMDSENISLETLYELVECNTIQIIGSFPNWNTDYLMCIDDNGKIENKTMNSLATSVYGQFPMDFIVGKAVIGVRERREFQEPDMYAMPEHECKAIMMALSLMNGL